MQPRRRKNACRQDSPRAERGTTVARARGDAIRRDSSIYPRARRFLVRPECAASDWTRFRCRQHAAIPSLAEQGDRANGIAPPRAWLISRSGFWRATEGPEADAAGAGLFTGHAHVKPLTPIERNVALVFGFEIARELFGVGALKYRTHQSAAKSLPLTARLDAEQG